MNFSNEKIIGKVLQIPNNDILPNRFQPRKYFDEADTLELAESIKEHGILQPIVVRSVGDKYEIIAGERRFKANILAGNDSIPAIISNLNDKESSEIAVIENIQRQNLTPIEEAISYKRIIDMGYITQEELAKKIGKSQSSIANKIRLLKLSDNVQEALMKGKISERHARSLLKLNSLKQQDELLNRIINERLTVRKTDEEIKNMNNNVNNQENTMMNQPIQNNEVFTQEPSVQPNIPNVEQQIPQESNLNIGVEQNISPIMGTPVSIFSQPIENSQTVVDINQSMNQPQSNIDLQQSLDNNVSGPNTMYSNNQETQSNVFDQPIIETPIASQPSIINNDQPVMPSDFNQQNETVTTPSTDVPLESTPVTDLNNTNFLNTTPINTQENNESVSDVNPFTTQQPSFEQPIVQPTVETSPVIDTPTFQPEQPVETNVGLATPVVDLNQSVAQPQSQDIPITNNAATSVTPDPIIVTNDDSQFDPIMPEQPSQEPTLDFKTIINLIRQCSETIEKCGYKIDTEEYDLEGKYQVTFTIEK